MPLREYVCKACGRAFETLERAGEKPACPDCGSGRLERQLSSFAPKSSSPSSLTPCAGDCPSAGSSGCGCGCGCAGHHHH